MMHYGRVFVGVNLFTALILLIFLFYFMTVFGFLAVLYLFQDFILIGIFVYPVLKNFFNMICSTEFISFMFSMSLLAVLLFVYFRLLMLLFKRLAPVFYIYNFVWALISSLGLVKEFGMKFTFFKIPVLNRISFFVMVSLMVLLCFALRCYEISVFVKRKQQKSLEKLEDVSDFKNVNINFDSSLDFKSDDDALDNDFEEID